MELWIRSKDKKHLLKCEALMYEQTGSGFGIRAFTKNYDFNIANYGTKERCIEILDEIMLQMKNTLILSISPLMTAKNQHRLLDNYKKEFNRDFILETSTVEIKPLNSEIVLYEMPKE